MFCNYGIPMIYPMTKLSLCFILGAIYMASVMKNQWYRYNSVVTFKIFGQWAKRAVDKERSSHKTRQSRCQYWLTIGY